VGTGTRGEEMENKAGSDRVVELTAAAQNDLKSQVSYETTLSDGFTVGLNNISNCVASPGL